MMIWALVTARMLRKHTINLNSFLTIYIYFYVSIIA